MDFIIDNIKKIDGIDCYSIFLGSPLGYGKGKDDLVVTPSKWEEFKDKLRIIARDKHPMTITCEVGYVDKADIEFEKSFKEYFGCARFNESEDFFLIRADGNMYPCVFFSNEGEAIGNVYNSPIRDIINEYHNSKFYQKCGKYMPYDCIECQVNDSCRGGCRGYAKLVSGDWFNKDARCVSETRYWPICPIIKCNLSTGVIGLTSEHVR